MALDQHGEAVHRSQACSDRQFGEGREARIPLLQVIGQHHLTGRGGQDAGALVCLELEPLDQAHRLVAGGHESQFVVVIGQHDAGAVHPHLLRHGGHQLIQRLLGDVVGDQGVGELHEGIGEQWRKHHRSIPTGARS